MNAEEAISKIRFMLDVGGSDGFTSSDKEALNMAIDALTVGISETPRTNGDRIRQMTDEELAEFINISNIGDICRTRCAVNYLECRTATHCEPNILAWLEQEVGEDGES